MKRIVIIKLIIMFLCNIVFGVDKVEIVERNRYMYDEYMVNYNFIDFYNNDVKGKEHIKSLGYIDFGNIRCYHFQLYHSQTGYNRLAVYVTTDDRIIKTFLSNDNEVPIMTEKESWMAYVHINQGEFIVEQFTIQEDLFENPNWCQRQLAWCYETFVPSQEFVDDCTPSKETMKTVGMVVLITGAVILVIFAGASAMKSVT